MKESSAWLYKNRSEQGSLSLQHASPGGFIPTTLFLIGLSNAHQAKSRKKDADAAL